MMIRMKELAYFSPLSRRRSSILSSRDTYPRPELKYG